MNNTMAAKYIIETKKSTGRLIIFPGRINLGNGELIINTVNKNAEINPTLVTIIVSLLIFSDLDDFLSIIRAYMINIMRTNLPVT